MADYEAGDRRSTFLGGEYKCTYRTFVGCVSFVVQVMYAPVAFGSGTHRVILVRMVMLEQGVQCLHQPEAEEEEGQEARCGATAIRDCFS
jgi:hypothetical protein